MKLGHSEKELRYIKKWTRTREKGKLRFILLNGMMYGAILFLVWLVVSLIEINLSEFEKSLYLENSSYFYRRCVTWFICYMVFGFGLSLGAWKGKEEKYKYLS